MNCLEQKIIQEGLVKSKEVLKVDQFLNHQIDVQLLNDMSELFYAKFKDCPITKVLTIEASGIAIATMVAYRFKVPLVFAKKRHTSNLGQDLYQAKIFSFTHQTHYDLVISKDYLDENDHVLLIDDFLASGSALNGLLDIVNQAKASLSGIGIAIEKAFQNGGDLLREKGLPLFSLAIIESMDPQTNQIVFGKR
jgi:xanthine phosphoribosyltransferase